ncbi:hypothetical protein [Lentilactobacillus kisonensis]|uniref:Uncharacterized protein n=2 Tax=Lentilactobacillus kisonensis TaxID=481722 RepID=H1LHW8_9LACO|nr:hypothetical protein [Lentilactobacillus kisonensis]EHO50149.1 hypothetical protein HMPREF9104_02209 [Lentilactobacillus kisonensis F0435]KRL20534.1 hypothetical protein FC98_GL001397 [Lentilactobacillus kisonensis DSM 19906 = JCM 15041]
MMNEHKLRAIVETFAKYNIKIETDKLKLTKVNGHPVDFDATKYMQDQLIELICKVMANQLVAEVWKKE